MRSWMAQMALLALTPACGFGGTSSKGDGGLGDDDAPTPFPFCHGSFVKVCFSTEPTATRTLMDPVKVRPMVVSKAGDSGGT